MNSDLLDEYCEEMFGHTDWVMSWDNDGNLVITFHKEPRKEYWSDFIVEEGQRPIKMRKDLAREGILIPAGKSWSNYDDLEDVMHLSEEDLEGAYEYDTGEDPDSHAFCPVKLKNGEVVYLIGADLEWFEEEA